VIKQKAECILAREQDGMVLTKLRQCGIQLGPIVCGFKINQGDENGFGTRDTQGLIESLGLLCSPRD
jgi:hypothetical protein